VLLYLPLNNKSERYFICIFPSGAGSEPSGSSSVFLESSVDSRDAEGPGHESSELKKLREQETRGQEIPHWLMYRPSWRPNMIYI
jgi:hypothetical protein